MYSIFKYLSEKKNKEFILDNTTFTSDDVQQCINLVDKQYYGVIADCIKEIFDQHKSDYNGIDIDKLYSLKLEEDIIDTVYSLGTYRSLNDTLHRIVFRINRTENNIQIYRLKIEKMWYV